MSTVAEQEINDDMRRVYNLLVDLKDVEARKKEAVRGFKEEITRIRAEIDEIIDRELEQTEEET